MKMKCHFLSMSIFLILISISINVYSAEPSVQLSGVIALYFDSSIYQNSRGGNLQNGCEGWQTLHASGEKIFASRCDTGRLDRLGLFATEALKWNDAEPEIKKIKGKDLLLMIDFTSSKLQALCSATSQNVQIYRILNYQKKPQYYRVEGEKSLLEKMGFKISDLIKANETLAINQKVQIAAGRLNVAEDMANGRQMLIGKTANKKVTIVVIDQKGKWIGTNPIK